MALLVLTWVALDAVANVLLSNPSSAAPFVLPKLTTVICPSLGATLSAAVLKLTPLLLHTRVVRLRRNAMDEVGAERPLVNSELKKFTLLTAMNCRCNCV